MPGPTSSLPPLDDAVRFGKGVARVLSQMTGDPYGEPALSELRAVGIEEVICNMNFAGVLDHRQVLHSMQLFAANVMPQLA